MQNISEIKKGMYRNPVLYFGKVWRHKGLIRVFAGKSLKSRYTQTTLGISVLFLQAIIGLAVFSLFIGYIFKPETPVEYPLFAATGVMGWYVFSYLVAFGGASLNQYQNTIKKIYFPRIILPLSYGFSVLTDILFWSILIVILSFFFETALSWRLLFLPIIAFMNLITGLSVAIWVAALSVKKRDLGILIPYIVGFGILLTPVLYPVDILPEQYNYLMFFNPMAGVIEGYRWVFFGIEFPWIQYLWSMGGVIVLFLTGWMYFSKKEGTIADYV